MILTAHQPVYMPWLGLFHKIASADLYCYFDIAQYQTKDYNNRNIIKTNAGELWLSVPVASKNHFKKSVGQIEIIQDGWQRKHIKTLQLQYKKAPYYEKYSQELFSLIEEESRGTLGQLNLAMLKFFLRVLGITVPIVIASDYDFVGTKSELVLDMCLKLGADEYIFGAHGKDYADSKAFEAAGIKPYFQDYTHPVYSQQHGNFISHLSIVDLLFNCGDKSYDILMTGNIAR